MAHSGFHPKKRRLRDISPVHYMLHWTYSALEPTFLKFVDVLLQNPTLKGTKWGLWLSAKIASAARPLPHGIVITTGAAQRVVDYLDAQNTSGQGCFAVGKCLCQVGMNRYEGPLYKDIQFLYGRDMFLTLKMGHQPASPASVKTLLRQCRDLGYIHCLEMCMQSGKWLFCICNCESRICAPTRVYLRTGDFLWPGPEICRVDPEKCVGIEGCGKCINRCMFDAVPHEGSKAGLAKEKCMGCGLCMSTCKGRARKMTPRRNYALNHLVPADILLGK